MPIASEKEVEISRKEIEMKLQGVGDYVKMDYLQQCLKKHLDFDTRKYALTTLAGIYESRGMHLEAAKLIRAAAEINVTYDAKVNDYMKSCELFIKAGNFDESDVSFSKALASSSERGKEALRAKRKAAYWQQAATFLKRDKRKHAMETYEKMLTIELAGDDRKKIQDELVNLYGKLGKVKEQMSLQRSISNPGFIQAHPKESKETRKSSNFSWDEIGL